MSLHNPLPSLYFSIPLGYVWIERFRVERREGEGRDKEGEGGGEEVRVMEGKDISY